MKKLLIISSILSIIIGVILVGGGAWGIVFTYTTVARENITTPEDASTPNVPVRGPLTLKAQTDIIRTHVLKMTGGKTFAQMPRQIPKVDEKGKPVLDKNGQPAIVENSARNLWITATTLITALNLGLLAYGFFSLMIFCGVNALFTGMICYALNRKDKS